MNQTRKADLYKMISQFRQFWGVDEDEYNIDIINLCNCHGIKVGEVPFKKQGLRGIASVGNESTPDVIILNSHRNKTEQNVDCAHESIHLAFHRNFGCKSFNCFEKALPNQNKYLEWQANEGGAELLVPYKTLLPIIKKYNSSLKTYLDIYLFKDELVHKYAVTEAVITYRLESLKYEIEQYVNGISMKDLRILSYNSQLRQGISIKSLNEVAMDDLSRDFETKYCNVCQNALMSKAGTFCPICGGNSFQWGEGKMKYQSKIKLDERNKALRCPVCDNEEVPTDGTYCNICGTELVNQCTNIDSYHSGCGALAAANSRYCVYCGAETTFFLNGILKSWGEELKALNNKDDFTIIIQEWDKIIQEMGGIIRASMHDTTLEPNTENYLCIVFPNQDNYEIGRRSTCLGELERFIYKKYGKKLYLNARLKDNVKYQNLIS